MVLFRAHAAWLEANAPEFADSGSGAGIGAMVIVDYRSSPVGSYREVLSIPGRYRLDRAVGLGSAAAALGSHTGAVRHAMVSHIYVTTRISVVGGRRNWGLPKREADIRITGLSRLDDRVVVRHGNSVVLDVVLRAAGLPLPVWARFPPFSLLQVLDGRAYATSFRGLGLALLGSVRIAHLDRRFFPDIRTVGPLLSARIDAFRLTFPPATVFRVQS